MVIRTAAFVRIGVTQLVVAGWTRGCAVTQLSHAMAFEEEEEAWHALKAAVYLGAVPTTLGAALVPTESGCSNKSEVSKHCRSTVCKL